MLLERLNRDHFYPEVICNQFSLKREIEKLNVRAHRIDFPEITIDGEFKKIEILKYFKTLRIISLTLRKRHFDLIYSNSGLPCQIGLPLSKLFRIPILVHLHAPHPLRYAWMWLFKYADKVLFVSHYIKEQLTSKVKLKGHAAVAYNGVDCDYVFHPVERRDFRMKAELGWAENDIVIGQVGSLIRRKGLDILIKAFYRLRTMRRGDEVKLLIIGDGSLRRELEAQVTNLGIGEKVRFTGETDHPSRYYQHAIDINVLASRSEAFPLSLLEASACGVPNVCTRCEGMIEGVIDGSTGLHFEKENSEDLADKLRILIENPSLCRKMGKNGRRLVERNFSAENYARRIQLEIRNLVQQGGSKSSLNRLFGRTRMTGAID
jgi:glycosyltransferase involved in cell wall biosynthesis